MKKSLIPVVLLMLAVSACGQSLQNYTAQQLTAADILGNPDYPAFSYGGYRERTRNEVPSVDELKEDMKILSAMGVKIIRTYNTQQFAQAENLLKAIRQLKDENQNFEMYVMLGVWIESKDAWTDTPIPAEESLEGNTAEIEAAIRLTNTYPDIIKVIAVGNEAMVHWAVTYFVHPKIILKWVNHLQELKASGGIPAGVWITSSDNFASWGGGDKSYHTEDLTALIKAVDYISMHTYPFQDTYYNPEFWGVRAEEESLSDAEKVNAVMVRVKDYAASQYQSTRAYMESLGVDKPIHIGETGWASKDSAQYGAAGSQAAGEYKQKLFYQHMRDWTDQSGISCFFFEAFDEHWKDEESVLGSENHFGLINLEGEAKHALWDMVDAGAFDGLTRNGMAISKTYAGNEEALLADILPVPSKSQIPVREISTVNENRRPGELVTESNYVIVSDTLVPDNTNDATYPSEKVKLESWKGGCEIALNADGIIEVKTGSSEEWGCALELDGGVGEDLSAFVSGYVHFKIKGDPESVFDLGVHTGSFAKGTQVKNHVRFAPRTEYSTEDDWKDYSIPFSGLGKDANMKDLSGLLYLTGDVDLDGGYLYLKDIHYSTQ
ncbi:MAG: exo-beta-1,3-glucanase [Gammaproteobacteria bacterium]|nr:exo-beta-1,3-glucanase [Gammaproteobacteria bacterium]